MRTTQGYDYMSAPFYCIIIMEVTMEYVDITDLLFTAQGKVPCDYCGKVNDKSLMFYKDGKWFCCLSHSYKKKGKK